MKYFTVIICLALTTIIFADCQKESKMDIMLIGSWELREAQTSMLPTKVFAAGNGNVLKFSDSTYEKFSDGTIIESGHYEIVTDSTVETSVGLELPEQQFSKRIILSGSSAEGKTFIEVSNDTLILLSGYFPLDSGSRHVYKKMKSTD